MVGAKPKGKVNRTWSPKLAYALGLLATDGSLSKNGRHISLSSNDREQIENLKTCLGITNKITRNISGNKKNVGLRIQFGDVLFYRFLVGIGFTPAKSKTLGSIDISQKYFFHFLRGCFDGDGSFYSYYDPRWKSSFMFYTIFASASKSYIEWLRGMLVKILKVKGYVTYDPKKSTYQLRYAKKESLKILRRMYQGGDRIYLSRKKLKIERALGIVGEKL